MLSYQHAYHAGNFADVLKHLTLSRLFEYMTIKENPMMYLETHAGRGSYDLHDKFALKTGEAAEGIELLWAQREQLSSVFSPYLKAISHLNKDNTLQFYPGSPSIAIQALRSSDRLFFSELHKGEFDYLQQLPRQGKRVIYSQTDGFDQLKALLPPNERRGLIFLDPSYEIKTDYRQLPLLLKAAYQRFSTGVYCVWYPIVDKKLHEQLLRGLEVIAPSKHLRVEFYLSKAREAGMTGTGLWIINPPFVLQSELKEVLDVMRNLFNPGISSDLLET